MPSPFPKGWYFVASREAIEKAKLIEKTWMGEDIVIWCDEDGDVCVADAYCPHLGSYLGPAAGGRIRGGRLVCPFHGFEYDATGQCVATPYADPPRNTKLRAYETMEVLGLIFAWWGIEGREPQWSLPDDHWTRMDGVIWRSGPRGFPGHPQETTENSVDLAHLSYVHGYASVKRSSKVSIDGPCLESRFDFRSIRRFGRIAKLTFDLSASTRVFGLGYSYVEIREHSVGIDMRLWVLATPVEGTLIDLSLVLQVAEIRKPRRWIAGLGFLPVGPRAPVMTKFMAAFQQADVLQDVVIWSRKRYQTRPRLSRSDGEIMPFRTYCAQFYPDQSDSVSALPVTSDTAAL